MTAESKVAVFEESIVLPALAEVSSSEALLRDFAAEVVVHRPSADPRSEELLATLAGTFRKRTGPSLVLVDRRPPPVNTALAGRFAVTLLYELDEDDVFASPGVMFWMAFNNKLHGFAHRYDNAVAYHSVEDITRPQVLNHLLGSLTFYKAYAFSPTPFPGYR